MAEEKNFENKVKKYLKEQGCWFLKTWSNGIQRTGVPDILVCCEGYFLGVEVKASNGKPSELQLHELDSIDSAGGYAILLYPDDFDVFKTLISAIKNFNSPVAVISYAKLNERRKKYDTIPD